MWFKHKKLCALCQEEKSKGELCASCYAQLEFLNQIHFGFYPCHVILYYNHFAQTYFKQYKFYGKSYLAKAFGEILYQEGKKQGLFDEIDGIVPVPMTRKDQRQRGYDQVMLLAKALSFHSKLPILPFLQKIRQTKKQHQLHYLERQSNLDQAFAMTKPIHEKKLLLLDDFVTTGNTMKSCGKVLEKEGNTLVCLALFSTHDPKYP